MPDNYFTYPFYESPSALSWNGRVDGTKSSQLRLHQVIDKVDIWNISDDEDNYDNSEDENNRHLNEASEVFISSDFDFENCPVLLGFCSDEGVRLNMGRPGAINGPAHLRKALANLPFSHLQVKNIYDVGNIHCPINELIPVQKALGQTVFKILQSQGFPIVLGGGHEVVFGNFQGVRTFLQDGDKKFGIINYDAHFDLRDPRQNESNSGTGFFQIERILNKESKNTSQFNYLVLGIQPSSNTEELFQRADDLSVSYVLSEEFHVLNKEKLLAQINEFLNRVDVIYLTIDLDVFASAYAPGVSAPSTAGIIYDSLFLETLKLIAQSKKVLCMDIAELNPLFDVDERTARLGGQVIFDLLRHRI